MILTENANFHQLHEIQKPCVLDGVSEVIPKVFPNVTRIYPKPNLHAWVKLEAMTKHANVVQSLWNITKEPMPPGLGLCLMELRVIEKVNLSVFTILIFVHTYVIDDNIM